jgi:hypothetical protein
VSSGKDVKKLLFLLVLNNFIVNIGFECIYPSYRFKINLDIVLFSRVYGNIMVGNKLNKLLFKFLQLSLYVKCDFNLFLRLIDQTYSP